MQFECHHHAFKSNAALKIMRIKKSGHTQAAATKKKIARNMFYALWPKYALQRLALSFYLH